MNETLDFLRLFGGFVYLRGFVTGLGLLTAVPYATFSSHSLSVVPLFILMGEVMFHSGIAPLLIDTVDKWLGRLPGRLGLLAVGTGTIFAVLSGSTMGTTAMLGSVLVPEMEKRGYKKSMSLGPILGSGNLSGMGAHLMNKGIEL